MAQMLHKVALVSHFFSLRERSKVLNLAAALVSITAGLENATNVVC